MWGAPLFSAEYILPEYSDLDAARWWIQSFDCEVTDIPEVWDWDDPRPGDSALKLPGSKLPTIALRQRTSAGPSQASEHPVLFCSKLAKGQDQLRKRGANGRARPEWWTAFL